MNHVNIARALLAGWWIILGSAALTTAAAFLVTSVTAPIYRASSSFYVSVAGQDTASAGDIAQGSTAAQQKIKSYTTLASSPRVLQRVIDELHLETTPAELGAKVTATAGTGTVIIAIAVSDHDARTAARLAESVGDALADVVSEIEPTAANGDPSVKLEEVTPATTPTAPVSPKTTADLALGAAAGLAVGAGLTLLRAAVDTRVRRPEDLDTDVPLVGDIAFDADAGRRPLIVRDEANSARTEAFLSLRTNIQFLRAGGAPSIAVTSARPSEGKTTSTANLAIALSKTGVRAVVVDADFRRPNLARTLDLEGAVGLSDLLVGRVELEDVLQEWGTDGLVVLAAGTIPPNPSELIGSEAMERVLAELTARFDVVLVDTPPVLAVTDAAIVSTLVSTTLLVTAANQTKKSDVRSAIEALARVGQRPDGIVLTKTRRKSTQYGAYRSEYVQTTAAERA